jgi:hypothetical protein
VAPSVLDFFLAGVILPRRSSSTIACLTGRPTRHACLEQVCGARWKSRIEQGIGFPLTEHPRGHDSASRRRLSPVSDCNSRVVAAGGASGRMVQRKLRIGAARGRRGASAAARGRRGAKAAARRLRRGTRRGGLRGGASSSLSVEQCLLAASGGDAESGRAGAHAETPSFAGQRDVTRFGP